MGSGVYAIRDGDWKLIARSGGFTQYKPPADAPKGQLYNLADDPGETKNLYRDLPDEVRSLTALLGEYQASGSSVVGDGPVERKKN